MKRKSVFRILMIMAVLAMAISAISLVAMAAGQNTVASVVSATEVNTVVVHGLLDPILNPVFNLLYSVVTTFTAVVEWIVENIFVILGVLGACALFVLYCVVSK